MPILGALVCHLALLGVQPRVPEIRILFLGNSHTMNHDVPQMVRRLIESTGKYRVRTEFRMGSFLNDIAANPENKTLIRTGKWSAVVLQAAKLSSSHRYQYSHQGAIELAQLSLKSGSKALLFAEWPRRGWNEVAYILGQYGQIAKGAKGAKILPIPQAWDAATKGRSKLDMWEPDGNHARMPGSYLAACVIAKGIVGTGLGMEWRPDALESSLAFYLRNTAQRAISKQF
jgi:hypothetical protein